MELDSPTVLLMMQMPVLLGLALGLMGVHKIQESDPFRGDARADGWLALVAGTLLLLMIICLLLFAGDWLGFSLVVGLPVLASFPAYWLYRFRESSRVFVWIAVALWLGLTVLTLSVDAASSGEGLAGYWGLAAAALTSISIVYGYRKLIIRKLTLSPSERRQAAKDPWGTIGAAVGLTVGGAILRGVVKVLSPELRAAVDAFMIGLLAFSILGCAAWQFLWEIKRRGQ